MTFDIMLTLNLISKDTKKEIKLRKVYRIIKKITNILLVITFIISIMMVTAKYILKYNYYNAISENESQAEGDKIYNAQAGEINSKLKITSQVKKDFIPWSYLIKDLADKTPTGITFSNIELLKNSIKIIGNADWRDNLLVFKQNLEKSNIYSNVNLPITSLLDKQNINFTITANLNLEDFIKTF